MKTATRVSINSLSNIMAFGAANIVSLLTLPTFIRYYGESLYGVFILAIGVTGTLALIDFGINTSLTRFVAEYEVDRNRGRVASAYTSSVVLSSVIALAFGAVIFILSFFVEEAFKVGPDNAREARVAFQLAAAYTVLFVVGRIPQSILEGFQLFYVRNLTQIGSIAFTLITFWLVRSHGLPFLTFCVLMMAAQLVPALLNAIEIRRRGLLRDVSLRSGLGAGLGRSEFLRYSGDLFMLQLISVFTFSADKFVIGAILGPGPVSVYNVVTKPMFIVRMVNNQTALVFGPLLAQLSRRSQLEMVREVLTRGTLMLAILIFPLVVLLLMFIQPFIDLWIGEPFSRHAYWGAVAGCIFLFTPFSALTIRLLIFTDAAKRVRSVELVLVAINLTCSVIGTFYLGIGGVILGSLIQSVLAVPMYRRLLKRQMPDVASGPVFGRYTGWLVANVAYLAIAGAAVVWFLQRWQVDSWLRLVLAGAGATTVLYLFGLLALLRLRPWQPPRAG